MSKKNTMKITIETDFKTAAKILKNLIKIADEKAKENKK